MLFFLEGLIYFGLFLFIGTLCGYTVKELLNADTSIFQDVLISAGSGAFLGALLYPFFTGNLGHRIVGLKVISSLDGSDYKTSGDGAVRELLKALMSFLIIPLIWLLFDTKNQNLYDKITKTYVVKKNSHISNIPLDPPVYKT